MGEATLDGIVRKLSEDVLFCLLIQVCFFGDLNSSVALTKRFFLMVNKFWYNLLLIYPVVLF